MKNAGDWRPARFVAWLLVVIVIGLPVAFYIITWGYRFAVSDGNVLGGIALSAVGFLATAGLFALLYWLASRKKSWFGE